MVWSVKLNNALLPIGNWACQERQIRFPYGYKGIIMLKKENVNQKDTICDTKKAAT